MNSRSCTVSISACVATLVMTTACNGSQWRAEDHHIHSHHSLGDGTYSIEFNARQATFVLFDEETESLWFHLEGDIAMTAISGEYVGMRSAELPSGYTTWSVWKELHPESGWLDPASLPARSAGGRGRDGGTRTTRHDRVDQGQG